MSDVGDVNRAHQNPDNSVSEAYIRAARKMLTSGATTVDRLRFLALHNPTNVVLLATIIDELRAENAQLMEQIFKLDKPE